MGGEEGSGALAPRPEYNRVKNFLYHLIYVSKAYIPNLRPLAPSLHLEKFVVGGWVGGGWWVFKPILGISLVPSPSPG